MSDIVKGMPLYCSITRNYNNMCGVVCLKNFSIKRCQYASPSLVEKDMFKKHRQERGADIRANLNNTGAQYFEAGFINDELSTEMFDQLTNLFPLVFLSEKRKNINSGNEFYFAVFDIKDFV